MIKRKVFETFDIPLSQNISKYSSPAIPEPLEKAYEDEFDNSIPSEDNPDKKIILLSQRVEDCNDVEIGNCMFFDLKNSVSIGALLHAKLWVYIYLDPSLTQTSNISITISGIDDLNRTIKKKTTTTRTKVSSYGLAWYKFNVKNILLDNLNSQTTVCSLKIACSGCSNSNEFIIKKMGRFKPFIQLQEKQFPPRSKRYANNNMCNDKNMLCCREDLWIDFQELNWFTSSWPSKINAYYCKGSCSEFPVQSTSDHAQIRQLLHGLDAVKNEAYLPCCVPTKMKKIKMLLASSMDPNVFYVRWVPDLIVEECGCS